MCIRCNLFLCYLLTTGILIAYLYSMKQKDHRAPTETKSDNNRADKMSEIEREKAQDRGNLPADVQRYPGHREVASYRRATSQSDLSVFICTCGNTDPHKTKVWTNNFTGNRYIICTCCGRYQDETGKEYGPDTFSLKALGGIKPERPSLTDLFLK